MLKNLLHTILKENIQIHPTNHVFTLFEPQNKGCPGKLEFVTITDVPDDTLVLKPELSAIPLFKENGAEASKYRRCCDYIFISKKERRDTVVYIEMKSSTRHKKYIHQLWGGRGIIEYLNYMIKNLDHINPAFDRCQHYYVKLCSIPLDKDTTNVKDSFKTQASPKIPNIAPGRALIYNTDNGANIKFNELIVQPKPWFFRFF